MFSPHDFKKNNDIILSYFKNKWKQFPWSNWQKNFIWTKFWLSEIIGIENHFYQEVNQRKSCSRKLYVTAFNYVEKILIVLSSTSSGVSIISFTSIAGAAVGIASARLTLFFSLTTGIVKKSLNITRKKNMIKFLWNINNLT